MKYHCKVCDKIFTKFIIFEGHFDFNDKCRAKHTNFLQCYICLREFLHLATLKYHLRQHRLHKSKNVNKVPEIPKITLKKQWNFKILSPIQENKDCKENESINSFECKICNKTFRLKTYLRRHLFIHSKERLTRNQSTLISPLQNLKIKRKKTTSSPNGKKRITDRYRCKICRVISSSAPRLVKHMEVHTSGEFLCTICNIKFSKLSLVWHQKIAHGRSVKDLQCKKCKAFFSSRNKLKKHEDVHIHGNVKCEICKLRFTPNSLVHHQKHCRPATILFPLRSTHCKICDTPCNSLTRLAEHKKFHKCGKFFCDLCNVRFSQSSLIWHQRRFHPEVRKTALDCKICKATFKTPWSLKGHVKVHEIGKLLCDQCPPNKIHFTQNSLLRHQRIYHPEVPKLDTPEKCEICKVKCYSRTTLDSHNKMHKEGKFECCQIKFTSDGLESHKKRFHSTPKQKNQCTVCKINVAKSNYLEQHMKVHVTGDVMCDLCQIKFTRNSLVHHQKVFHPELDLKIPESAQAVRKKVVKKLKRDRERAQKISRALEFQCKLCKLFCGDAKKLDSHMKVHLGTIECGICKVPFTKRSLEMHERRFHSDVPYKDRILKALRRHISSKDNTLNESDIEKALEEELKQRQAANKSKVQCVICQLPCGDSRKLDIHNKVHLYGEYKCNLDSCNIWFTKHSLESHQRRCHSDIYKERVANGIRLFKELPSLYGDLRNEKVDVQKKLKTNYQCNICNVQCSTYDKLVNHRRTHITGTAQCAICQIRFTTKSLIYHQRRYHPEMPKIDRDLRVQCRICKIICSDAKRLELHLTVHESDLKCEICNIPFTKRALEIHDRRFHPHLQTNELIEKALERNAPAEHHMPRELQSNNVSPLEITNLDNESIQNQYNCEICKLICSDRKRLETHMKVHLGDVKCLECNIWFTKASLGYHYKRFHPDLQIPHEQKLQRQCDICKLMCYDAGRLKTHMKVHSGDVKCSLCNIWFTKVSLVYHYKRFHPNVPKKEHILRAIENCAFKKTLHHCKKCGKSFTRICYLKLHMKSHRNGTEELQIPIGIARSSDAYDNPRSSQIDSYECYVCKKDFPNVNHLKNHLYKHVVYQQWVDPLNIYLSNWNPEESREILQNQPLVLVENLDIKTINLKSLANFDQQNLKWIEEMQEKNGCLSENDLRKILNAEKSLNIHYDMPRNEHGTSFEMMSINEDDEPLRSELKNNEFLGKKKQLPAMARKMVRTPLVLCISSDSDSDDDDGIDDITEAFHCYFCNARFRTLNGLGLHVKLCPSKYEPPLSQI